MNRSKLWPQLGLFLILVVGTAVAWGFVVVYLAETFVRPRLGSSQTYESLSIAENGEPMIWTYPDRQGRELRSLAGEPIDVEPSELYPTELDKPRGARRWTDGPITWSTRIVSAREVRKPATAWFGIRDSSPEGRLYLVGFDEVTRLRIGYLGREGFRRTLPPVDEQFVVGGRINLEREGRLVGSRSGQFSYGGLFGSLVYLIDDGRVVEVDVRERSVRPMTELDDALSVAMTIEPSGDERARLAVRLADRVAVLTPGRDERVDFPLPLEMRDADSLHFYLVGEDEALVDQFVGGLTRNEHRLTWINSAGEVTRQETVELAAYQPNEPSEMNLVAAACPVPLAMGTVLGLVPAFQAADGRRADSYGEAARDLFAVFWPRLAAVAVASALAAWVAYRLQRRYGRGRTGLWCTLVLLTGVPGLLAYVVQHGRPAVRKCDACGTATPGNRLACVKCGSEAPQPRKSGNEVFA